MINFKANLHSIGTVQKLDKSNHYTKQQASFVELDTKSKKDLNALERVATSWKDNIYATDTYYRFKENFFKEQQEYNERFFALTTQKKGFDKLDHHKILGVAEIYLPIDEDPEIEFLQTNPKFLKKNPKIKHTGKVIIDKIKQILQNKTISLYSTYKAIPFYEKQGFKVIEENLMKLVR